MENKKYMTMTEYVKSVLGDYRESSLRCVFSRAEPVMQLTIHYKDGSKYNVKNAFNIEVNKHKSGGFDIEYDYEYTVTKNLPHGSENSEVAKHVETKTHDVIAITLTERKQNNVRKTEIVEFGK